jgi:tricorn protease
VAALLLAMAAAASSISAAVDARMFRHPDVSADQIAFVYAGDIWVVEKAGGVASRLSSPAGEEAFPRFSPDGERIAFSASYDGNVDVYQMPAGGGVPERLTWHPGSDRLLDWTPDGEAVLFASNREHGINVRQFFRVAAAGGWPEKLPVPYGEFGALAGDGRRIAYTTKAREFSTWKRYRGGLAPDIWLLDLDSLEATNLTVSDANDMQPMWHGDKLYFLSDRGPAQRSNLWVLDGVSAAPRQVTAFTAMDVAWPAIGPAEIVFQAGGRLHLLDLATEEHHEVPVEVVTDRATLRPRLVDVGEQLASAHISPSGARAVVEARGEIFTLPAEHGVVRQLTRRSGTAERYPAWSPDGSRIAYWSDRAGEYELTLLGAPGDGEEVAVTALGPGFRYRPFWSPDSSKIAFIDNTQTIRIVDVESAEVSDVDQGLYWMHPALTGFEPAWSPDSRWLAWHRQLETGTTAIFVFDTETGERHQLTSGFYSDTRPAWDPDGDYLYYLSNRSLEPVYSDLDATWIYPNTTRVVAASLRGDVPSPLAPRNDEEPAGEEDDGEKDDADNDDGDGKGEGGKDDDEESDDEKEEGPEPVEIDLEEIESRAVVLPPEPGAYSRLRAVSGKLLYHREPRKGSSDQDRPVLFWDFEEREEKTILGNADSYEVSADGKKLLVERDRSWAIVDLAPDAKIEDPLPTASLQATVDPRAEWRQIFEDVWRTYRDNFYDPGMHGLDWEAVGDRYRGLLEDAVTRWDVTFVIGQLIAEINASHTYVFGGDNEQPPRRAVGLLGIDWELDKGAYRIARIVRGASWDAESRSPLAEPGVEVAEGDYILAVNGLPLDTGAEPWAAFSGLAGRTVQLTVNDKPSMEGARRILVETLDSDRRLRRLEWIEARRSQVDEETGGRVGYVYVPDTGRSGQSELVRQYTSQAGKDGLIVDERWNAGGQLADRFVELMNRQLVIYLYLRHGATMPWPVGAHFGPKVMLINGWAGSGGDAFPFFFREMKAGPLIGERTWGGLIGPAFAHRLVDGGIFTAPPARLFGPDGVWFAEGHGVDPDIPVVDDPGQLARGTDPQLEAAINEVMRLIETDPPPSADPPPFESRVPDRR